MDFADLHKMNIKNIVIFVSDSLRWDFVPSSILKMGTSIKTIASSLYTAPSFASMICGLYPIKTGVSSWGDILPSHLDGLLNLENFNSSLWCETTWTDLPAWQSDIHKILRNPKGISLKDIEEPFIYIEDDKGGHCPYGIEFNKYSTFEEFFTEYGKKGKNELVKQYQKGVIQSEKNFKTRLKTLSDRGLNENTLIIFTSDHGELLGEYGGLVGHGRPSCPELVYVPTVFIHPSLNRQIIPDKIIRHVDFFPTILSILNKKINYPLDGIDLTYYNFPTSGLNFLMSGYFKNKNNFMQKMIYKSASMWDYNGGYVLHYLEREKSIPLFSYKIICHHPEFAFLSENIKMNSNNKLRDFKLALKHFTDSLIRYNNPCFSEEKAIRTISEKFIESEIFNEKIRIRKAVKKLYLENKI
jgi:hypothetical protein